MLKSFKQSALQALGGTVKETIADEIRLVFSRYYAELESQLLDLQNIVETEAQMMVAGSERRAVFSKIGEDAKNILQSIKHVILSGEASVESDKAFAAYHLLGSAHSKVANLGYQRITNRIQDLLDVFYKLRDEPELCRDYGTSRKLVAEMPLPFGFR